MMGLLLFGFIAHAQDSCKYTLKGVLLESESGNPIAEATLFILEQQKGTHSSQNGKFSITGLCPGEYTLICQHLNHETYREKISLNEQNLQKKIFMTCKSDSLHQITIKGTKNHWEDVHVMHKLDALDLFKQQGVSLGKSLEKINGVYSLSTGNNIQKPVIRGLHSNRILILNNEIRQEGQQWGNEHAPEIDPFIAKSIVVVKGAQSIRYGCDIIGGVILINPKPLQEIKGVQGEFNTTLFSNGRGMAVSGLLEGEKLLLPKLTWRIQGTIKRSGNNQTPTYFLKNTGMKELNYSAALGYTLKNINIEYFHSYFNTDIAIFSGSHIGNLTDLYKAFEADKPIDSSGFSYQIDLPYQQVVHQLNKVNLTWNINPHGMFKLNYAFQQNTRKEFDNNLYSKLPDGTFKPSLHFLLRTHHVDAFLEQIKTKQFTGIIGVNGFGQTNQYFGNYFIPNYNKITGGIYMTEKWHKNKLSLEGGLRYDVNQFKIFKWENNVVISPSHQYNGIASSFGARYKLPYFTIHFNGGTTWRAPFVNELYSYGVHHSAASFEIGDRSLKPERSIHHDLTLDFKYKNRLDFELTAYYNYIKDYIVQQPIFPATLTIRGAFPTFKYMQTDAGFVGFEFAGNWNINKTLSTHVKGNLIRAKDLKAQQFLPGIPPARASLELSYTFIEKQHIHTDISFGASYNARQYLIADSMDYVAPPKAYSLFQIDLNSEFKVNQNKILFNLNIANVFNTQYRDYMNRNRYFANELGRNISLRLSIPFNLLK